MLCHRILLSLLQIAVVSNVESFHVVAVLDWIGLNLAQAVEVILS
jgi:hypothetical protein